MKKHLIDYVEWEGYWCKTCRTAVELGGTTLSNFKHPDSDFYVIGCLCLPGEEEVWIPARFWLAVVNPGAPGNTTSPWPDLTDYGECGIIHPTIHRGDVHDPS